MAPFSVDDFARGIRGGDRMVLARAITLIESNKGSDQEKAQALLGELLPETGRSRRIAITGVPGVGKSTIIETLGMQLVGDGHRIAVLAVDPTSRISGGSILGDKTRMAGLARHPDAFIRPSPSSGSLGGVARKTRETMLLCEAAGFDVVLVETVGVGQSETTVSEMVDFFLLLLLPGAGDVLQGIKRGILELADMITVNKSDGENRVLARRTRQEYESALQLMRPIKPNWITPVVMCAATTGDGVAELWTTISEYFDAMHATGHLDGLRQEQMLRWMWSLVDESLLRSLRDHPGVVKRLPGLEQDVLGNRITPTSGALEILRIYRGNAPARPE